MGGEGRNPPKDNVEAMERQSGVFASKLDGPLKPVLAEMLYAVLYCGARTPGDFMEIFSPRTILESLYGSEPQELRTRIVSTCTGLRPKLTASLTAELQITLVEGAFETSTTNADELLEALQPDDCVRYLPLPRLWTFTMGTEPWKGGEHSRELMVTLISSGVRHELLDPKLILEPVIPPDAAVPSSFGTDVLWGALRKALGSPRFGFRELLDGVTIPQLVAHSDLEKLWKCSIYSQINRQFGDIANMEEAGDSPSVKDETAAAPEAAPAGPDKEEGTPTVRPPPDISQVFDTRDDAEVVVEVHPDDDDAVIEVEEAKGPPAIPADPSLVELFRTRAGLELDEVTVETELKDLLFAALMELEPNRYKPGQFRQATAKIVGNAVVRKLRASSDPAKRDAADEIQQALHANGAASVVTAHPDPNVRAKLPAPPSSPRLTIGRQSAATSAKAEQKKDT